MNAKGYESMQTTDIKRDLRDFLVKHFLSGDAEKLSAEGSLLGDVIDSMGTLDLVAFLQERFGIVVADDEVLPRNFDTINNLVAYVEMKIACVGK